MKSLNNKRTFRGKLKLQFFITSLKTSKAGPDCLKLKAQFRILSRNGKILLHYAKISAFMSLKLTMVYVIQLRFAQTLICLYLYYRRYILCCNMIHTYFTFCLLLFLVISLHWLLISKNRLVHYPKENRNTFILFSAFQ